MKFYDEEKSGDLPRAFEDRVLKWPDVEKKKRFGCPCYEAGGKLFAFLVNGCVVITELGEEDRQNLHGRFGAKPFGAGPRTVQRWAQVPLAGSGDLEDIMPFIRRSFQGALGKAGERPGARRRGRATVARGDKD